MLTSPIASIVIPAHNEAAVIERCLRSFADGMNEFEVVVACNGCTDDTAVRAKAFEGVRVIEVIPASKVAGLNAGDLAATVFPRIYLDADIEVTASTLRRLAQTLSAGAPAAAPLPKLDTTGCTWATKAYFRLWRRLGYVNRNLLGSGIYGLSESGRSRFGEFPDLIADDGFVYSQFAPSERVNPPGAYFTLRAPRNLASTYRRRVRIVQGNKQLEATGRTMEVPGPFWHQVLRRDPRLVLSAFIFLPVNLLAARTADKRLQAGGQVNWNRDTSRREGSKMVGKRGVSRALQTLRAPGTYKNFARLANFFGYDIADQSRINAGAGVRMSPTVSVRNGERIRIGAGAHIGQGCYLWAGNSTGRIDIGDHALLAPDVMLTASDYDFDAGPGPVMELPKREADIVIGSNTWLGAKVVVVAGVSIGDGTIVAAGSVVTKDLPPNVVAAGVPAKVIRPRGKAETGQTA